MSSFFRRFFGQPLVTLPLALALFGYASALIFAHAMTVRQVNEAGLPAAAALPQMEKRLALLQDQAEAMELQEALKDGSAQDELKAFVIPQKTDLTRLLATFDVLRDVLQHKGLLRSLSPIEVGQPGPAVHNPRLRATPIHFTAEVTEEGMDAMLLFFHLSGLLTVSDALSPSERSALINLTEQENPAALTVLEQFLGTDLLQYASDPTTAEREVLRSLTSASFEQHFTSALRTSSLAKAKYLLGDGWGKALTQRNLWPTPLLSVQTVDMQALSGDAYRLDVTVQTYTRL